MCASGRGLWFGNLVETTKLHKTDRPKYRALFLKILDEQIDFDHLLRRVCLTMAELQENDISA